MLKAISIMPEKYSKVLSTSIGHFLILNINKPKTTSLVKNNMLPMPNNNAGVVPNTIANAKPCKPL